MSKTLLLIGIGPVQEFIATARKLRDLWFGSWLLSELSKTVARSLHENGATLIFPAISSSEVDKALQKGSDLNVANKILARVASCEEAHMLQRKAKEEWRAHLEEFGIRTLEKMDSMPFIHTDKTRFNLQMTDYGEFFSAWVELEAAGGYNQARNRVEGLLASRKSLRTFRPPTWDGAGVPKNSLDGIRETVLGEKTREVTGLIKKNERLDAMGCIKRFYPLTLNQHFDDLSDIALCPWLEGIMKDISKFEAFTDFQKAAWTNNNTRSSERRLLKEVSQEIVSDLFYADRSTLAESLGENGNIKKAWNARNKMIRVCGEPNRYAVILVGDGDNMGKMIDAIDSEKGHILFTTELSRFAKEVGPAIEEMGGSLIYSGGDDVMAYLPLHTAVPCAESLRNQFYMIMKNVHDTLKIGEKVSIPTFSAGLAIVHHSMPLDQALKQARTAEQAAKQRGGRNALAIAQHKRSGGLLTVVGKWDPVGDLPGMGDRINAITDLYNNPEAILPARLGYQLREAALSAGDTMVFTKNNNRLSPGNAAAALIKRIFDQKNDGNPEKNKELARLLSGRTSIRDFSDELVVGHQIAIAVRMAAGKETS